MKSKFYSVKIFIHKKWILVSEEPTFWDAGEEFDAVRHDIWPVKLFHPNGRCLRYSR